MTTTKTFAQVTLEYVLNALRAGGYDYHAGDIIEANFIGRNTDNEVFEIKFYDDEGEIDRGCVYVKDGKGDF